MFFRIAAIVFFIIPLLEALLFQNFSSQILIWVAGVQMMTAFIGWIILRKYPFNQLFFLEAELRKKSPIVKELWEECIYIFSGILLITPGFFTDISGAILLLPDTRKWLLSHLFYDAY